jgi:di/tricarboxylate transporter
MNTINIQIHVHCRDAIAVPSVVTAMLGLSILLLLGVLNWDDCLSEKSAWDTLAWFSVLVGMAGQLTNLGIVSWMSNCVAKFLASFSLSWPAAFGVLQASYFFLHYVFASQTGHVGALYSAFLAMHLASGVPGVLSALALAFNTNLFGALTHYSSGQAAVYFGGIYFCFLQQLIITRLRLKLFRTQHSKGKLTVAVPFSWRDCSGMVMLLG